MAINFEKFVKIEKSVVTTTTQKFELDTIALETLIEDTVRNSLNLNKMDQVTIDFECRQGVLIEARIIVKSEVKGE